MLFSNAYSQATFEKEIGPSNLSQFIFLNSDNSILSISVGLEILKISSSGTGLPSYSTGLTPNSYVLNVFRNRDSSFVSSGESNRYPFLAKTSSQGITQWAKYFDLGSTGLRTISSCMKYTGEILSAGSVDDSGIVFSKGYLQLSDSSGDLVWAQKLSAGSNVGLTQILETSDYGFLAGGGAGNGTCFIKLDSSGNISWSISLNDSGVCFGLTKCRDGSFITTGSCISNSNNGIFICKLDSLGLLTWYKRYSHAGMYQPHKIIERSDGSFIIAGSTYNGSNYGFLMWLDALGNLNDAKKYTYTPNPSFGFWDLCEDNMNNLIVLGTGNISGGGLGQANFIMKADPQGLGVCDIFPDSFSMDTTQIITTPIIFQVTSNYYSTTLMHVFNSTGTCYTNSFCTGAGTENIVLKEILLYPNPAHHELTIKVLNNIFSSENSLDIQVYNSVGQLVLTDNSITQNSNQEINLPVKLPDGIYFGILSSSNGILPFRFSIAK